MKRIKKAKITLWNMHTMTIHEMFTCNTRTSSLALIYSMAWQSLNENPALFAVATMQED